MSLVSSFKFSDDTVVGKTLPDMGYAFNCNMTKSSDDPKKVKPEPISER
jgi:hypothetical protein